MAHPLDDCNCERPAECDVTKRRAKAQQRRAGTAAQSPAAGASGAAGDALIQYSSIRQRMPS